MTYFKKIVGDRIYLSPMQKEDASMYIEWMNEFNTSDGLGNSSNVHNVVSEEKWIENNLVNRKIVFSIVTLENNDLIGNCGFNSIDHIRRTGEVGIFIGPVNQRNMGYGSEALKLLLDFGFNYLNLHSIFLKVFSFNELAIACYKKVGFKEVGRRRQSYFLNGSYYDEVFMDILEDEFNENYIRNKYIK